MMPTTINTNNNADIKYKKPIFTPFAENHIGTSFKIR